jgi:hypothetical protein
MTIKIPKKSIADKLLKLLGKKRGVYIPAEGYKEFGPYIYSSAKKESFWRALLRPKSAELPKGMIDIDVFRGPSPE